MIPTLVQRIEVGLDLETIKIVFRDAGCTRLGTGVHCCHIIGEREGARLGAYAGTPTPTSELPGDWARSSQARIPDA
jgi:hypothetical protein